MRNVVFNTGYNFDQDELSAKSAIDTSIDLDTGEKLESLTQQQFAEECDINEIVRRFGLTGQMPENFRMPVSGDFTGVGDFQSAMNMVVAAREEFMTLPASVREEFGNDPQQLMKFLENEKNRDRAIEMGLIPKPAEKTRDVIQAVDDLAAKLVPPVK